LNFSLHRFNPRKDEDLRYLYQAYLWENEGVPVWYSNASQVFGADTWEDCLKRAYRDEQIDVGVFDEARRFSGLITVVLLDEGTWEVFIAGPRRSEAELFTRAAFAMAKNMFDARLAEKFISWVCTRHRGALKLNRACGMVEDGVTMLKGSSHGRPLEWKRLVLTRQRMQELTNGQGEQIVTDEHKQVRVHQSALHA
jgi:hypothetical protein